MRFIFLLLALSLLSSLSVAAELKNVDDAVALTDQVMKRVAESDMHSGIMLIKPYSLVPQSELDTMIKNAEAAMPQIIEKFGKVIGYEHIRNETAGSSLVRVAYLHRFERHAVVWQFILYKNLNGWIVSSVTFNDDITSAF